MMKSEDIAAFNAAQRHASVDRDFEAASRELESLTPELQSHPDVLCLKWLIATMGGDWQSAAEIAQNQIKAEPDNPVGWIHCADALHAMNSTKVAIELLISAAGRFPKNCYIRFRLACYACRLGNFKEARAWLNLITEIGGASVLKALVQNVRELEPLGLKIQ